MLKKLMVISLLSGVSISCADAQTSTDGQATPGATRISIASHSVRFSDIPAVAARYRGAAVPVMENLVEDGMITG